MEEFKPVVEDATAVLNNPRKQPQSAWKSKWGVDDL
jgi:hypothetical protein